jgi:hypothetical protein
MSGASLSSQVSAALSKLPNALLHKPFDMRRLVDIVRDRIK